MKILLVLSAVLLFSAASVNAEILKLTVNDAIKMALENNSKIKAARLTSDAAAQGIWSVNSRYLPALFFEETLVASNSPTNAFMMKLDEGRFNPADFSNPYSVIARTRSKCKLGHHFSSNVNM